ncbi:hypothetical protein AAE478_002156 [Parahypoxylon ruwenzoriense]
MKADPITWEQIRDRVAEQRERKDGNEEQKEEDALRSFTFDAARQFAHNLGSSIKEHGGLQTLPGDDFGTGIIGDHLKVVDTRVFSVPGPDLEKIQTVMAVIYTREPSEQRTAVTMESFQQLLDSWAAKGKLEAPCQAILFQLPKLAFFVYDAGQLQFVHEAVGEMGSG